MASNDSVNHPNHYASGDIECIDAIREQLGSNGFIDYCHGNVAKYLWRWRAKGGIEDLKKARVYLGWMIEEVEYDILATKGEQDEFYKTLQEIEGYCNTHSKEAK